VALRLPLLASSPSRARPARSFVGALGQALEADPDLVALLGGVEVPKVWYKLAPNTYRESRVRRPWVTFALEADSRQYTTTAGDYVHAGRLLVAGYSDTSSATEALADAASEALMSAWWAGTLLWSSGLLMQLRLETPLSPAPPAPAAVSGRLWRSDRRLKFRYSGVF
jgi:hypothetical protein